MTMDARLVCLYSPLRAVSAVGWVLPSPEGTGVVSHIEGRIRLATPDVLSVAERLLRAGP